MPLPLLERAYVNGCRKPAEFLRERITMPNLDNQTIELALIALVALAMLIQAIVLLAVFRRPAQGGPRHDAKISRICGPR